MNMTGIKRNLEEKPDKLLEFFPAAGREMGLR
jgi:hypothetical protein